MRVSRDKVNKVAHVVTDALAETDALDFIEDRNTIRLEVRKILEDLLNQEEKIDQAARYKIESQKRTILEALIAAASGTSAPPSKADPPDGWYRRWQQLRRYPVGRSPRARSSCRARAFSSA